MEDPISNLRSGLGGQPLNQIEQSYRMPDNYQNQHSNVMGGSAASGLGGAHNNNFTVATNQKNNYTNAPAGYGGQQSSMMYQSQNNTQMLNMPYASEQPTVIGNDTRIDVLEGLGETSYMNQTQQSPIHGNPQNHYTNNNYDQSQFQGTTQLGGQMMGDKDDLDLLNDLGASKQTNGLHHAMSTPANLSQVTGLPLQDKLKIAISKKLLSDESVLNQMQGEFSVIKGYGNDQAAALYSVSGHHKAKGQDHILYAVNGVDNEGQFEIFRRYKEFLLLRTVLSERFPGLYVPPIPPKRMSNKDADFLEERRHLLNLFIKQLCHCPYLYESEELKLFIRPHIDLEKALTLLPKLNPEQILERTIRYYSFMGEITESKIQKQNNSMNKFAGQIKKLYQFLEKFRDTVGKLEQAYDAQWIYHKQLNEYIYQYEEQNLRTYAGTKFENFLLFKHPLKTQAKDILENLPTEIRNPFKIMKLWLKWEMLDINALLEAIDRKTALETKKQKRLNKKESNQKDLNKLNNGKNTLKTIFLSQDSKVNKITYLTHSISEAEKQIECFDLYLKIIVLQLSQSAIPYFKKDKVSIYNDLINTYSQQQINNSHQVIACYTGIMNANRQYFDNEPSQQVTNIHELE
eukprot:403337564